VTERLRLFVALDLDPEARSALASWRDALLAGRSDLRATRPETLHMTLAFLGWQSEASVERIGAAALGAAEGLVAPVLGVGPVRAIPAGRPRLFALDLSDRDGRAGALQAAVSDALEAEGVYTPEKRPFWPHVTLARVRKGERAAPRLADVPAPVESLVAPRVTLYRSTLHPSGAVYDALAVCDLT
jgi:2'-5' RNA ligase